MPLAHDHELAHRARVLLAIEAVLLGPNYVHQSAIFNLLILRDEFGTLQPCHGYNHAIVHFRYSGQLGYLSDLCSV